MSDSALNDIANSINRLSRLQNAMSGLLDRVAEDQVEQHGELRQLIGRFAEFELRDERSKNVARAELQIVDIRQQLQIEFGHYEELRNMATGIVEAVDAQVVTHDTIQSLTESVMITTPRYWLAPALVGLAAWFRDERLLAENAVRAAMRRDSSKTALFYGLVLRRYGRTAAAAHWIRRYVERQDPGALPREFVVILDAVATGALGQESRPMVLEAVGEWYDRLGADPAVVDAQVLRWRDLIRGLRVPVDPRIKALPEISPDWARLKDVCEGATVHGRAERHLRAILDEKVTPPEELHERVDAILDNLVNEFDQEEAPLRRKFAEQESIRDHNGDLKAAAAATEAARGALEDTTDYLTLLTNAAFFPEKSGTSPATRQLAIALARDWIVAADVKLAETNRALMPKQVTVKLEGWTGDLAAGAPLEGMEKSLQAAITRKAEADAAKVKPGPAYGLGIAAAAVFLLIAVVTAVHHAIPGTFICVLIAGFGAFAAVNAVRGVVPKQQEIREKARKRAFAAVRTLRQASAEYTDLMTAWQTDDEKSAPLTDYLSELKVTAVLSRSPDQIREVMK
ncbi:MAG TPA: hypothetical protein VGS97_24700 [Actinocrinis sp.]|uniref:hypothetical protein n=1 Tax=Actinocrinis sp. TaxID=1920516 RepID=UPI002DDCEAB2|nr:hypothetical protein [Actinocrinis sp.]HEV2347317.1 hypothetical protein [Actinocrinis sp.]